MTAGFNRESCWTIVEDWCATSKRWNVTRHVFKPRFPCTKTVRFELTLFRTLLDRLKAFGILDFVQKNVRSGELGTIT